MDRAFAFSALDDPALSVLRARRPALPALIRVPANDLPLVSGRRESGGGSVP